MKSRLIQSLEPRRLMSAAHQFDAGNTLDSAYNLGTVIQRTVHHSESLGAADSADYFKITTPQPAHLDLSLKTPIQFGKLALLDSAGNTVASTPASHIASDVGPGVWYIEVTGSLSSVRYSLTIKSSSSSAKPQQTFADPQTPFVAPSKRVFGPIAIVARNARPSADRTITAYDPNAGFKLFLQNYLSQPSGWERGDFNYNGAINATDFQTFLNGYIAAQSASSTPSTSATPGTGSTQIAPTTPTPTTPDNDVFVKYTYYGDENGGGGKVDLGNDFNLFLQEYLAQGGNIGDIASLIHNDPALTQEQKDELLAEFPGSSIAKLGLNDTDLIVSYPGDSPASTIRQYLQSGFNAGNWSGNGIASQAAQNNTSSNTALGYGEATDLGVTSFDGQPITGNAVIIKYTSYGDSNLDGKVDLANDFIDFVQGYTSQSASSWEQADYNYDGKVDTSDFKLFISGFQSQGGDPAALKSAIQSNTTLNEDQKAALLGAIPDSPST
jgi:hypothetical protein